MQNDNVKLKIQNKYFRRAKLIAALISVLPFTRAVLLDGSVSRGEAEEGSDIDFCVITKPNRIWTARFLVTAIVQLTGYRRYQNKIAGRICLNRYQTADYLVLGPQKIQTAEIYRHFMVLWSQNHELKNRFYEENNWIKMKFHQNFTNRRFRASNIQNISAILLPLRLFFEFMYEILFNNWGEGWLRAYQTQRIKKDPRTRGTSANEIFYSDREIRFHPTK